MSEQQAPYGGIALTFELAKWWISDSVNRVALDPVAVHRFGFRFTLNGLARDGTVPESFFLDALEFAQRLDVACILPKEKKK